MTEKLHNIVYKITNLLNNKIYIGFHATDDLEDDYMGSGKALKLAFKKYGIENFTKEILHDVENEELGLFIEELLVDKDFISRKDTYNLVIGGQKGALGYNHSEEAKSKISKFNKGKIISEDNKEKLKLSNLGKKMSNETKDKIRLANLGKKLSQETKLKISNTLNNKNLNKGNNK